MQVNANIPYKEDLSNSMSKLFNDQKMLFEQETQKALRHLTWVMAVKLDSFKNVSNVAVASLVVVTMSKTESQLNETILALSNATKNGVYQSLVIDGVMDIQGKPILQPSLD